MEIKKINVSPQMAASWLGENNQSNRRISDPVVKKYADDMASKNWIDTHQNAIAFFDDGTIADGQHRLAAIVQSGITVQMFVATGLDRSAASAIDQGRSRTVANGLLLSGIVSDARYIGGKVSVAKLIHEQETGKRLSLSVSQIADTMSLIGDGLDFAIPRTNQSLLGFGTAYFRGALVVGYYNLPFELMDRFARVVVSGMAESQDDLSVIKLRNWLLQNPGGGGSERASKYRTTLRVLHAYSKGESLGVVRRTDKIYFRTGMFDNE